MEVDSSGRDAPTSGPSMQRFLMRKRVWLLSPMLDRIRRLWTSAAVGRGSTRVA
jgi:hypothetical protein